MVTNEENKNIFNSTKEQEDYNDDAKHDKNDVEQIDARNKKYTQFLSRYYDYINEVLSFKQDKRTTIYYFSLIILATPLVGISIVLYMLSRNDLTSIGNLVAFVTALGALISSMIIIPSRIGDYLFSNDDTQQMGEIIKNIQDYDKNVREEIRERKNNGYHKKQ